MIFHVDIKKIRDFEKREFLLSLGNGSYSMNNILLIPSRRYHSLYNYALNPPINRKSFIHNIEETVCIDGQYFNIFSRRLSNETIFPEGYKFIKKIIIKKNFVIWFYKIKDILIIKKLTSDQNNLNLSYSIRNKKNHNVKLFIRPFFENRDTDSLISEQFNVEISGDNIKNNCIYIKPENHIEFKKDSTKADYFLLNEWKYKMPENLLTLNSPGYFITEHNESGDISFNIFAEEKRKVINLEYKKIHNHSLQSLLDFSESFIVNNKDNIFLIAGFPWFGPWGRDTFISLPGLVIYTQAFDIADNILESFSKNILDGIIPNLITETGECHYNTVDSSLWFINAIWELYTVSKEKKYIDKYYEIISSILFNYRKGTINNIFMDKNDFLINAGDLNTQLTWMDAKRNNVCFTPRFGKAVEINALWYNAVKIFEQFSEISGFSQNAVKMFELGEKIKDSFNRNFWSEEYNYLFDCIHKDKDNSLRPNQLFSISLPFPVITDKQKIKKIVNICTKKLYTENGIRTLSPDSINYKSNYSGDWFERDSCYHQGTAWPFLIGTYFESYLISENFSEISKNNVKKILIDFVIRNHRKSGCGYIPEIFDGSGPQIPQGAPMQAWSSAEILRLWIKYFN
ncbi:MAG: amylo-alpha-1,6-glucosidase [Candidatus Muirbacterium halophilum]|nr:amylo-alpha-1,6-glucosidase [Candidatus Muirbacterium halophilum]MCK9475748.1 amylo-alpha-1,6-glucosidase [Candidatus Muirbacterium halophilum]